MFVIVFFFQAIVFIVIFRLFVSRMKRARYRTFTKIKSKPVMHTPKGADFVKSYSVKNKECFEHEVKTSSLSEQPKRKKSLWNEPSWDDELYEKK
jgi:hypothetical protein